MESGLGMNNFASEADIYKLAFSRDVLQEQIDARIATRYLQILEAGLFFRARKMMLDSSRMMF